MKEKNMKLKIFFIAILFIIMPLILFNNSYALELNEEYVKEDFKFDETGKILLGFSDQGKEKLKRNDGKLVLDGNVIGDIEDIGIYIYHNTSTLAFDGNEDGVKINELEFKNLENLEKITQAFHNQNIKNLDLSPLKNIKHIGSCKDYADTSFSFNNCNIEHINFTGLDKLETLAGFTRLKVEKLDLTNLKNLRKIIYFGSSDTTEINLNGLENLEMFSAFDDNKFKEIDLTGLNNLKVFEGPNLGELEKINFGGLEKLEKIAFLSENNLREIDLTGLKNLKTLGSVAEKTPEGYYNYDDNNRLAFTKNKLNKVKLNDELQKIGTSSFANNPDLKDIDISNCKNLKEIADIAFLYNNTRLHVAYKNPNGLKDAEKVATQEGIDNNKYGEDSSYINGAGTPINGHVIVDDVQERLDEVTEDKKLAGITAEEQAKLDEIKDIIKKQFASEEELNAWLKEKGFTERENKIIEDNKLLGEQIDAKLEEIRNLEPYAKTNEELLKELDEVAKEIEEYNKKYNELNDLYIEEIKELLAKEKAEKEDLNKKLTDLQAEKDKELKAKQDTINHLNELIDKLNKEADANKKKISELENNIKDLQEEKTQVEAEKAMLENKLAETQDMLKAAEKNNDKASEEIMNLKNKISELEEKLAKCKEHCKKLEEELNNTKADLKNEQEENAKLNEKIKKLEEEKAELANKNKELIEKEEERKKQEELEKSKEELEKQKEEREGGQQEAKEERAKEKEESENNGSVTTNRKSTKKKDTKSNNKLPYAGSESVIILSLITIGAIIYTKRIMKRK